MIQCDRCKCEIEKHGRLTEAVECVVYEEDQTDIYDDSNVWRFCKKCWEEMIEFLIGEGQLGS